MTDQPQKVDLSTPDIAATNRELLEALFPGVTADGVLDATRLGELLDIPVTAPTEGRERFGLMWAGKQEAIRSLLTPSRGTLVPDLERSIDFDNAENVFVEGDNLEVLKLLQKAYNDKVKLIYIDPPYNTGNDFVYNDDFSDGLRGYLEYTGQLDEEGNRMSASADTSGRRHSKWLSMMYPRLVLARNLLTQDGAIFVSIDDNEIAHLLTVMDEVFGRSNFLTIVNWKKRGTGGQHAMNSIIDQVEYVVAYARDSATVRLSGVPNPDSGHAKWRDLRKGGGQWQRRYRPNQYFPIYSTSDGHVSLEETPGALAIYPQNREGEDGFWENGVQTVRARIEAGELRGREINGRWKVEQLEIAKSTSNAGNFVDIPSTRGIQRLKDLLGAPVFENPKPPDLIRQFLDISDLRDGDVVLDFFAGSCSTADALIQFRAETGTDVRFVVCNIPEIVEPDTEAGRNGFTNVSDIGHRRVLAAAQELGAPWGGMRVFCLRSSHFHRTQDGDSAELFDLNSETLVALSSDLDAVAAEVLLGEGIALDTPLSRHALQSGRAVMANDVSVVQSLNLGGEIVTAAFALSPRVVVFLEDGFAGKDAVKANAFTRARQLGITMKTV